MTCFSSPLLPSVVYLWAMVLVLCTACQPDATETVPDLSVEWTEVQVIGADESVPEGLLNTPYDLVRHPNGMLLVVDGRHRERIHMYDSEGAFLGMLGEQGQGPGEYERVTAMTLGAEDDIVVYDEIQSRVIRFDAGGHVLEVVDTDDWFHALVPDRDGFILAGLPWHESADRGHLRTVLNDLTPRGDEFALMSDFFDGDDPAVPYLMQGPVLVSSDGDRLYWTQEFSDGIIRTFERTQNGWTSGEPLQGWVLDPAYQVYVGTPPDQLRRRPMTRTFTADAEVWIDPFGWSLGLIQQPDGVLLHFRCVEEDESRVVGVDVFDAEGTYLGFGELERFDIMGWSGLHLKVAAGDDEGHVYVLDQAEAVVRVYEVNIE